MTFVLLCGILFIGGNMKKIILTAVFILALCVGHAQGVDQIKRDEGLMLKAYKDSNGWAIGYGHTSDVSQGDHITLQEAKRLFLLDLVVARKNARRIIPNFDDLAPQVQNVFVNMAFQLGGKGLSEFDEMIEAIEVNDWPKVIREMLNSDWAKNDSPKRARRLAKIVRDYKVW